MIVDNTPFQKVKVKGRNVWIKREDLSLLPVAFSKVRGIYSHLEKRPEKYIGVLDTFHSKAGWGVSLIGKKLNKKVVVFYPEYVGDDGLRIFQKKCLKNKAELISLKAGRSAILYHSAKKILREKYSDSYMMPNALKLPESVEENCAEAFSFTPKNLIKNTIIIISISSGTVASGVLKGFLKRKSDNEVYIHMGYSRSLDSVKRKFRSVFKSTLLSQLPPLKMKLNYIDEKYGYKDRAVMEGIVPAPFPCNPYYDLKAWKWMINNMDNFPKDKNILFWNIGA